MNNYDNVSVQGQKGAVGDRPVFYYVTLASGSVFDQRTQEAVEKTIRENMDLFSNPSADHNRHWAIEVDPLEILTRKAS